MKFIIKTGLLLIVAVALAGTVDVFAQSGGASGAYTRIGLSPRIIAIGNAYTAGGAEGIYSGYNPAMAARIRHNQLDLSGAAMTFDRQLATFNLTLPLPPNAGLAVGLLYAGVGDFDGRTQSGYFTENFSTHDLQFIGSFGLQVSAASMVGVNVKFQTARYNKDVTAPVSFGIDLGYLYSLNRYTQLGITVKDMVANYVWDTQDLYGTTGSNQTVDKMPIRYTFGIRHHLPVFQVNLYGEIERRMTQGEIYGTQLFLDNGRPVVRTIRENSTTASHYVRLGGSWQAHERFTLRGGWQSGDLEYVQADNQISTGFSLHLPYDLYSPTIDYALLREPNGISWMHMFSVRLNFNQ